MPKTDWVLRRTSPHCSIARSIANGLPERPVYTTVRPGLLIIKSDRITPEVGGISVLSLRVPLPVLVLPSQSLYGGGGVLRAAHAALLRGSDGDVRALTHSPRICVHLAVYPSSQYCTDGIPKPTRTCR